MDWWSFTVITLNLIAAIFCGSLVAPSVQRSQYGLAALNGVFCVINSIFLAMRIVG